MWHAVDHGVFSERIHMLGLTVDSRCNGPVGESETLEHVLYECFKSNSIRDRFRERALVEKVAWPLQLEFCVPRECYKNFARSQNDAVEAGKRDTSQTIVFIVRNRI